MGEAACNVWTRNISAMCRQQLKNSLPRRFIWQACSFVSMHPSCWENISITLGVWFCAHAGRDTDLIESHVVENAINDVCGGEAGPALMRHAGHARCAYHQWSIYHIVWHALHVQILLVKQHLKLIEIRTNVNTTCYMATCMHIQENRYAWISYSKYKIQLAMCKHMCMHAMCLACDRHSPLIFHQI